MTGKKVKFRSKVKLSSMELEDGLSDQHQTVLLNESVKALIVKVNGIYVDATFGRGGHSREILRQIGKEGVLVCIDKDHEAIKVAQQINDERLITRQGSFTRIKEWIKELGYSGKVSGILLDLGVSSPQLDEASRGFSFLRDGPLDMRMDQSQKFNAAMWINKAKEEDIVQVLKEYGEERFSKRIANAIVKERKIESIETTGRLSEIVSKAHPRWEVGKHPATRVFQAIRIFINSELQELTDCLEQCLEVLEVGGRLVTISFHSLEDRIVKNFIEKHKAGGIPDWVPLRYADISKRLKRVGKVIHASEEEVNENPRSRSALLRIMEKLK